MVLRKGLSRLAEMPRDGAVTSSHLQLRSFLPVSASGEDLLILQRCHEMALLFFSRFQRELLNSLDERSTYQKSIGALESSDSSGKSCAEVDPKSFWQ